MFKCTGICNTCGRCKNAALISGANDRKTKIMKYPKHFKPMKNGRGYGIAFDIGTTTVVGMLWDLKKGVQLDVCAKTNPQNEFGMDVITRIAFCEQEAGNLDILRSRILDCLNNIIMELCDKNNIKKDNIYDVVVCGNTTMSHVFAGYSPKSLALAPFLPAYKGTLYIKADEIPLMINNDASIVVVPNIAGHVGGDITAGIIASDVLREDKLTIFIDIGTNGEIVLTNGEKIYACSTAAGPAFEGAAIKHGMRAAIGAIERVAISDNGDVFFKTIGDCEPKGICGSGLIDAIAAMVEKGIINKRGKLLSVDDVEKKGLPSDIKKRIIKTEEGRAFILVSKAEGEDIIITQRDIREVQLAKGAIFAGILLMLNEMGKEPKDVEKIMIAGAFGSYIDIKSAMSVGILPKIDIGKVVSVGNTAGVGVSMILAGKDNLRVAEGLPENIEHIELSTKDSFQKVYMEAMLF